jgi:hypothetical protein
MAQLKGGTTIAGNEAWHAGNLDGTSGAPSGGVIIWPYSISSIPSGWFLCDGANGTIDMRDMFVYGASVDADIGVIGGSADAIVVAHSHTANHSHTASSNTTGAHTHATPFYSRNAAGNQTGLEINAGRYPDVKPTSSAGNHSHTITVYTANVTTSNTGSSGTNANLPPYIKLAYIQRV